MATAQLDLERTPQEELVERWRYGQLRQAGYEQAAALKLSWRTDIDLHLAVDLLRQGCPPELALRILC